jgi:hypothetical protein
MRSKAPTTARRVSKPNIQPNAIPIFVPDDRPGVVWYVVGEVVPVFVIDSTELGTFDEVEKVLVEELVEVENDEDIGKAELVGGTTIGAEVDGVTTDTGVDEVVGGSGLLYVAETAVAYVVSGVIVGVAAIAVGSIVSV